MVLEDSDHQFFNTELTTFLIKDVLYLFQMQTPDGEDNTWETLQPTLVFHDYPPTLILLNDSELSNSIWHI